MAIAAVPTNEPLSYLFKLLLSKTFLASRPLRIKLLKMENTANAKPEYDRELKIYRSARRYEGAFYRSELNLQEEL